MKDELALLDLTREGVAVVTLNRPSLHNAFNPELIERLDDIFTDLARADGVRVMLLDAKGTSFSAGADLDWMRRAATFTEKENQEDAEALARMLRKLRDLNKPTVALVQGAAIAGGVGLVAACDVVIAVRAAFFRLTEVRIGLIPAVISPYVAEAIGLRQARRFFLTAESFDAEEARRMGLVHILAEDQDALSREAERLVDAIFSNAPGAIAAAKALIDEIAGPTVDDDLLHVTARAIAKQRQTAEAKDGIGAYLAKTRPSWIKSS